MTNSSIQKSLVPFDLTNTQLFFASHVSSASFRLWTRYHSTLRQLRGVATPLTLMWLVYQGPMGFPHPFMDSMMEVHHIQPQSSQGQGDPTIQGNSPLSIPIWVAMVFDATFHSRHSQIGDWTTSSLLAPIDMFFSSYILCSAAPMKPDMVRVLSFCLSVQYIFAQSFCLQWYQWWV